MINKSVLSKYDVPGPRYTSYPTAPNWDAKVNDHIYKEKLRQFGRSAKTLSLYIHIPFCQTMCTYCACNVVIRKKDRKYAEQYVDYLAQEIRMVRQAIGNKKKIVQLHLGGGTPTFLDNDQLARLMKIISENFDIDYQGEIAIEIDPRTIDHGKLEKLKELGFNRVSFGVQDFDKMVQEKVNRKQPFELVERCTQWCRELKFKSLNFDLIYGLPGQTLGGFKKTVDQVINLKPDRIALYSFAYVPWLKHHQRKIEPADLPAPNDKLDLFIKAREMFLAAGYKAIAMDHFALADDELARAFAGGNLYRNFMGYTVKPADEYIGLGMTSIGFLESTFIQNQKTLPQYYASIDQGELPVERGKVLSGDDRIRQYTINSLMCQFMLEKAEFEKKFGENFDRYFAAEAEHIKQCQADGLLELKGECLRVTQLGRIFIRNICMGFDQYLKETKERQFSKTV